MDMKPHARPLRDAAALRMPDTFDTPLAPPPATAAPLTRRPVVDGRRAMVGYLLHSHLPAATHDAALPPAWPDGTEPTAPAGRKLLFLRCSFAQLASGLLAQLDPATVVLELPSPVPAEAGELATRHALLAEAHRRGFRLAFDADVLAPALRNWLPLVTHVQIALDRLDPRGAEAMVRRARSQAKATVVARRVRTPEQFEQMRRAGAQLFEGNWFTQPTRAENKAIQTSQASVVRLLNLVLREAEVEELEDVLRRDPTLGYALLRFINSAGQARRIEVCSFRQAVMTLGMKRLFRWTVLLLTATRPGGAAPAAGHTAIVRGRMMELLGRHVLTPGECEAAFIAGVFSLLDALLGMPLAKALAQVQLPAIVGEAVLHCQGVLAPYLRMARACEDGDAGAFEAATGALGMPAQRVNGAHLQALAWADRMEP